MRGRILSCLVATAIGACTKETPNPSPDAPPGNRPPPRVIPGGGIGDGAINGVVNLYVIDDKTRLPVPNATVRVGTVDGVTDTTGLFVAQGVVGPQTVSAKATGFRAELWFGADGANLTMNLQPSVQAAPTHADLSGQITGFSGITVPAGHVAVAKVLYSQSDDLGDPANSIATAGDTNNCGPPSCAFKVTVRTGRIGLIAAIFDLDRKGTPNDTSDDTMTLIRWAWRPGITVSDRANLTGQDLALIDASNASQLTVDFGAPPSALTTVAGLVGLDTADDGVYQLPLFRTPSDAAILAPKLTSINATGYRLTAIASNSNGPDAIQSIVLRRALTGSTLAAGAWLPPPASVALSRTTASWGAASATSVIGIEYTQGSATVTHLLNVTVFDGSTSVTIPALVALPTTGVLDAKLSAIAATGLDVHNFALDADRTKLDRVAAQPITITN